MKFKRKRKLETGRLDITPLIDVVLLLLIFFMLSSSFISPTGIRINLPQSSAAEPQDKENLVIAISEKEELYFQDERISWEALRGRLAASITTFPDRVLIVKADRNVRHGKVVEVMSLAREMGWKRLAIAAHPEKEEQ